ncbi:MAG: amino acid adenylation domain-containing protein, partial [Flavobacteriales bacterium]
MENLLSEQFSLTALKDASGNWTFGELNRRASLIAYYLIEKYRIQKGEIVLMALPKSNQAIAAILGVLKSGAVYLPIDENLPEERLSFIKSDSEARCIIDGEFLENLFTLEIEIHDNYVFPSLTGDDLAYCIYTSGSTGSPKGTLVSHESLFTQTQARLHFYTPSENALLIPPLYFDASVAVIFPALLSSTVLHILDENELSSYYSISKYINEYSIDYLLASPGFYRVFFHSTECFSSVNTIIIGGESTSNEFKKDISNLFPNATIFIEYGLTETTVVSSILEWDEHSGANSIGTPFFNNTICLLNEQFHLVPYGSVGEICIGGVGLARGYLNREELTKEKFITNPYNPTQRLYRTGDLGRWREDGNLEYLGRIDDQVKIRGYRIELGEIEQALSSHPKSKQAVVIARALSNTTEKELIAYTTGAATAEELKAYLKEKLPNYMVPSYYVRLQHIPLTSNGKVDRTSLPNPEGTGLKQGEYVAPRTETEKQLVKLWSEVLGVEESTLSIKADFFDLGGHSIKAIRLLGQMHKQLGVKLSLKELFANPSVEQLSRRITSTTGQEAYTSITPLAEQSDYAVSSAQRRLWVLSRFEGANEAYNIPQVVRLEGEVNDTAFKAAYQDLLTRHEVLRTVFT